MVLENIAVQNYWQARKAKITHLFMGQKFEVIFFLG